MALGIRQKLLNAASTDETTVATPTNFKYLAPPRSIHTVEWGTGVSAGVVEIEAAARPDYTGTWVGLSTVTYDTGAPKAVTYLAEGPYGAFRHRISTAVAGGTVTSYIQSEA